MTGFQWFGLALMLGMAALTVSSVARGRSSLRSALPWSVLCLCTAGAIVWPETTAIVARRIGVRRGADLVSYLATLGAIAGFFLVSVRLRQLSRSLTVLVREQALWRAAIEDADAADEAGPHGRGEADLAAEAWQGS